MKFLIPAFLLAASLQAAEPALRAVLVELFTSEGCSSCPPADALLMKLDKLQPVAGAQIIVLSEHVDYWNSLGWADPFSSAQFSQRQDMYAKSLHSETFTPQVVIDGSSQCSGGNEAAVRAAIAQAASRPKQGVRIVSANRNGNEVLVEVSVEATRKGKSDVWVALADEHDQSSVRKGENAGKTMAHVAVVRNLTKVGKVTQSAGLDKQFMIPAGAAKEDMRVVVFVADANGLVLGSALQALR